MLVSPGRQRRREACEGVRCERVEFTGAAHDRSTAPIVGSVERAHVVRHERRQRGRRSQRRQTGVGFRRRRAAEHVQPNLQRDLLVLVDRLRQRNAGIVHDDGREVGRGQRRAEEIQHRRSVACERFHVEPYVARIHGKANRTAACGDRILQRRGRRTDRRAQDRLRGERRQTVLLHRLAVEAGAHDDFDAHQRRVGVELANDGRPSAALHRRGRHGGTGCERRRRRGDERGQQGGDEFQDVDSFELTTSVTVTAFFK